MLTALSIILQLYKEKMATGMVLSVAQTLFAALQCKELRDLCSVFGYESQLDEIESTVTTIKAVLLEAESKQQELTHEGQVWIENLKDVVYEVDDVLDEFKTMALQRQQMHNAKFSKKVRRFLSRSNKFLVAFNTSHVIKKVKAKLEIVAKNRRDFGFGDTYEPVKRMEDTISYVREENIVGRESDKEAIKGMLLEENEQNISFVTIVGIGGLGKTALAQLVFNDSEIHTAFNLKMWVCVSDDFSMEEIFSKMLEKDGIQKEVLQRAVRQKIEGQKYLLVLDDVWNENRDEWVNLRDFLVLGGKGSKVLVTSRSKRVASIIENNLMHELQGLSRNNSWTLFKKMAFENGKEPTDSVLVEKGKEIAKRCGGVPLSIRVIGSLLYGQEKSKWLSFKSIELAKMGEGKEGIMPILKFSYFNLTSPLKSCFTYCALFPKDYVIKKQLLINLWAAHGCLDGLQEGQGIEDVGEEYFLTLLQRCFLQDIRKDEFGEISSCKMHDLIHDLAQEVAGKEFSSTITTLFNSKIRHIFNANRSLRLFAQQDSLHNLRNLRTALEPHIDKMLFRQDLVCDLAKIISNCKSLRVLELKGFGIEAIPKSYNNLIHLRYLDLSFNRKIEKLPKSFSKLLNLQVLNLRGCWKLRELPKDLRELVNLRQLDLTECELVTHMPTGLDNLTCLHTLTSFVLGRESSNQVQAMDQLRNLKHLSSNLKGEFCIIVKEGISCSATNGEEGGYLINKPHLKALTIRMEHVYRVSEYNSTSTSWGRKPGSVDEGLLEGLQPHSNVQRLNIKGYTGTKLPQWVVRMESCLPSLVHLKLDRFPKLQQLPALSQLQHLKSLSLRFLDSVEYMEDDSDVNIPQVSTATKPTFFPSLEKLEMRRLPKLKGWWREDITVCSMEHQGQAAAILAFPRLHKLSIYYCSSLTSLPGFQPHYLKHVYLSDLNERLTFIRKAEEGASGSEPVCVGSSSTSTSSSSRLAADFDLKWLAIDDVGMINSLFGESLRVSGLCFCNLMVERLSMAGIENLTFDFQRLSLRGRYLELEEEGDDGMMPWKTLHNLPHLELEHLSKVVKLPKGFQCLTSLQSLSISSCENLEELPEWLDSLKSLQSILIDHCPKIKSLPKAISRLPSLTLLTVWRCNEGLIERCKGPDGEDWPKIRHIRTLNIELLLDF